MKRLHSTHRITILIFLLLSCFLLNSCDSAPQQKFPEGNIDVDSEIYIVPIGDNMDEKYLHLLVPKLERRFTTKVHVALDKRMPNPDSAYDYEAEKYVAMYIMTELVKIDVPENARILGVANLDIFVHRSMDEFIFGQAQYGLNSKVALISMFRMDPLSYVGGKPDDELLIKRMMKEAVHELGHLFGLRNCAEKECAMYLAKNLRSLDKKTDSFCSITLKEFRAIEQSEESMISEQ